MEGPLDIKKEEVDQFLLFHPCLVVIFSFFFLQKSGLVFKLINGYALDRVLSKSSNEKNRTIYFNYR